MNAVWAIVALVGALAFGVGLTSGNTQHVWSIYLVNVMFWSALAATGPAIAAMMQLTEARWSPSVRRIALTTAGFLPVSVVLIAALFFGREALYGWERTPVPVKAAWLNGPFFWGREIVLAVVLFAVCFALVRSFLRDPVPDDDPRERARRNRLSVILLFVWMITVSLWGFDLVMSIDPIWYSGLMGGYFVVTALYTTFCLLSIMAVSANARGVASIPPTAIQDVAKLQFAMSIMWMYFFWSQYLVIWYGNVPVETRFFVRRFFAQPWLTVTWVVFVVGWVIPFLYLLKRLTGRPPHRHAALVIVAIFGLVAIFLERVLVIFPSVSMDNRFIGWQDVLITAGFLGLFLLTRRWFFSRFRPVLNLPHTGH